MYQIVVLFTGKHGVINRLLICWGTAEETGNNQISYNFPTSYTSLVFNVTMGKWFSNTFGRTPINVKKSSITKTGFGWGAADGGYGYGMYYIAVGY